MKKIRTNAQLTRLKMNTGQIDWLPKNPRQWDIDDLDRTVASIVEDPDFLEDRPMLAVENGKNLIVFAGNLRLSAIRKTQYKTAPVVIYEPETDEDRETVKRRAMNIRPWGLPYSWRENIFARPCEGPANLVKCPPAAWMESSKRLRPEMNSLSWLKKCLNSHAL